MKKLFYMMAVAVMLTACGSNATKETEQTEETVAEIETAQLEGRGAARRIVNTHFKDSMELHSAILEANAGRSKYEIAGKKKCQAAFDSAFVSTIRTTRPDLAAQLEQR